MEREAHLTHLPSTKIATPRRYTINEFVEEKAPLFERLHDTSLEEARRVLRESMTAFLRWLPEGKEGRFPGTAGYHIRKISNDTFELAEDG